MLVSSPLDRRRPAKMPAFVRHAHHVWPGEKRRPHHVLQRTRDDAAQLLLATVAGEAAAFGAALLVPGGTQMWNDLQPSIHAFYAAAQSDFSMEESFLLMRLLDRLTAGLAEL